MANRMRLVLALALITLALPVTIARSDGPSAKACAHDCRSAHNQCRIATKNSPSCDKQLQICMQGCLRR